MSGAPQPNKTYNYLANLTAEEGEKVFTEGRAFKNLPTPDVPTFVLLIGSPGSGKSTALRRMKELTGLDPKDAAQISLDSLVESVAPFRAKTSALAQSMMAAEGVALGPNVPKKLVNAIAGKTSGTYTTYMKGKKNNRPNHLGEELPQSLNELRFALLDKALGEGKNIVYERTVSSAKEDFLREEVLGRIYASKKPYKIYVIYTKIDDPAMLEERLRRRPLNMMMRDPPFFRGVPSFLAKKFIETHEEYFRKFLGSLAAEGIQVIVLFADGRPDLFIPEKASAATGTGAGSGAPAPAGGRQTRRRRYRKRSTRRR